MKTRRSPSKETVYCCYRSTALVRMRVQSPPSWISATQRNAFKKSRTLLKDLALQADHVVCVCLDLLPTGCDADASDSPQRVSRIRPWTWTSSRKTACGQNMLLLHNVCRQDLTLEKYFGEPGRCKWEAQERSDNIGKHPTPSLILLAIDSIHTPIWQGRQGTKMYKVCKASQTDCTTS